MDDPDPSTLESIDAKVLDAKDRAGLDDSQFAFPRLKKLPLKDAGHVRDALARFNQTDGMTSAEKSEARARISRAAKKFGVKVSAATAELGKCIASMQFQAMSINLPPIDDHPNRMPFSGILTRVDVASDKPPNGSNGKRVMLTKAAAENALGSLMGMGVDLKKDMRGHDPQNKVGIITEANVEGDALTIKGFIYCADFPKEALRIHMDQASLGFSFEAQNLALESLDDDPLVIKSCMFTGAAILMKDDAAYSTTSLAAAAARNHEMDDVTKAVTAAIEAAMAPVTKTLGEVAAAQATQAAAQAAQASAIDELRKNPPLLHAVSAAVQKVEPHAAHLEAAADRMEGAGIGLHETAGHVPHLRRMAAAMRAEAHMGKMPHTYHDSGSYFAGAAAPLQQPVQFQPTAQTFKIEETAEYKALKAAADQQAVDLKKAQDTAASVGTQFIDLKAQVDALRPAPARKTLTPEMQQVLSRIGIEPTEDGKSDLSVAKIDAAMRIAIPDATPEQRIHMKNTLFRGGAIPLT